MLTCVLIQCRVLLAHFCVCLWGNLWRFSAVGLGFAMGHIILSIGVTDVVWDNDEG